MDPWTIVIWAIGVASMAAASWLQDRRDIRREQGTLKKFQEELETRIKELETQMTSVRKD